MKESHNSDTIIFYAPVGNLTKGFKSGGAEAGCRKTIEVLRKNGYEVLLVEKPAKKSDSKLDQVILFAQLFKIWIRLIFYFVKNKNYRFHVAGFYLNQIVFEWFFIKTANLFGVKTVYEIRNGGMIEAYESRGKFYQYFMRSTLLSSSMVLCQGYDYVVFLNEKFNKSSVYYPNYIMDDFVGPNNLKRGQDQVLRLIYFGRVVPDKNVDFTIDVCHKLKQLGFQINLDIIGSYEDEYYTLLSNRAADYGIKNEVIFHGRMDFKDIYKYLQLAHFFVFPSKEKREGHSNSLTEAMGCGVVPITSTAGFNESIVNDPKLVVHEYDPALYAAAIAEIWNNKTWESFSDKVYQRVLSNYVEKVVEKSLLSGYDLLRIKQ
ncbi:MAG: glycosyltransferase family 4 protein [Mucilaginibacter sp.]|uniref:glycosyltransferase family 4 protein n=1 Tax=Mucilaginibacter sp. TaxID=1882438 RepID=UPI0031A7C275